MGGKEQIAIGEPCPHTPHLLGIARVAKRLSQSAARGEPAGWRVLFTFFSGVLASSGSCWGAGSGGQEVGVPMMRV